MIEKVRPLPTLISPVLVNDGLVPDCEMFRPPALMVMIPLLLWAAENLLIPRPNRTSRVPRLSSCAFRLRPPLPPASDRIVAALELTRVPALTLSVAVADKNTKSCVKSMMPRLVKPLATVKVPFHPRPLANIPMYELVPVVSAPLIVLTEPNVPATNSVPWLSTGALIVLSVRVNVLPAGLISIPGPLIIEPLRVSEPTRLLRSAPKVAVALDRFHAPAP